MFTAVLTASPTLAALPAAATISASAPTPSPTALGWAGNTAQAVGQATQAAAAGGGGGMNWVFLGSVIIGIVTALFAYIGISQLASSRKGDVRQAGRQSAVAAIGTFWIALAIGGFTSLLVSGMGNFLTNVFTR